MRPGALLEHRSLLDTRDLIKPRLGFLHAVAGPREASGLRGTEGDAEAGRAGSG